MASFCWVCLGNACCELDLANRLDANKLSWKKKSKIYLGIVYMDCVWVPFIVEDDTEYKNACK